MVRVAQLVRASDCGSEGRGFEPLSSPKRQARLHGSLAFFVIRFRRFSINDVLIRITDFPREVERQNNMRSEPFSSFSFLRRR